MKPDSFYCDCAREWVRIIRWRRAQGLDDSSVVADLRFCLKMRWDWLK